MYMQTIPSKYAGQYVAWIDDNIVASATTQLEVYRKAKASYPKRIVRISYVPTKKETVTFL